MSRRVRGRWTVEEVLTLTALAVYTAGALWILGLGVLAVLTARLPELHASLHVTAISGGFFARAAERAADASHVVPAPPQVALDYLGSLIGLGLAGLVVWLRPHDRTARLLAFALVGAAGVFNLTAHTVLEILPLTTGEQVLQTSAHVVAMLSYLATMVLFPDGRPVPHWPGRRLALLHGSLATLVVALPIVSSGSSRPTQVLVFFGVAVPLVGAAAQLYRMGRTETATEAAQARLLFWSLLPGLGLGLWFLLAVGWNPGATPFAGRDILDLPVILYRVFQVVFGLVPLALFAGLVRYRLWNIERLLNRTVVYGLVTAVLASLYWGFVVLVQVTVGQVGRSPLVDSKAAVAVTTIVLMSAIRPLRDRVQKLVDRRFNRNRYDLLLAIDDFGHRVSHEVTADGVVAQLTELVDEVLQPRGVEVWLTDARKPEAVVPAGAPWPVAGPP